MRQIETVDFVKDKKGELSPDDFVKSLNEFDKNPDDKKLKDLLVQLQDFLDQAIGRACELSLKDHEQALKEIHGIVCKLYAASKAPDDSSLCLCRAKSRLAIILTAFEPIPPVNIEHFKKIKGAF